MSIVALPNNELVEISGDKVQIGASDQEIYHFTVHELELQKDDKIYLFTDGITDQFGGENGNKKYSIKRLREFLNSIKSVPLEVQMAEITREFEQWRAENPQTDDICFIGLQPFNP